MEGQVIDDISNIDSFDLSNKLKKKKKKKIPSGSLNKSSNGVTTSLSNGNEDERDYGYAKLLGRVFSIIHENNPELLGDKRRTVLRPPEVHQDGTKSTILVNFMELCNVIHRHPNHFMTFLLAEMDTIGSLNGQDRLVIKGRFGSKKVEEIFRKYIDEYVVCKTCKSPDTILTHEDRLFFIGCEQCGSEKSATPITDGFVARAERRKIVGTFLSPTV